MSRALSVRYLHVVKDTNRHVDVLKEFVTSQAWPFAVCWFEFRQRIKTVECLENNIVHRGHLFLKSRCALTEVVEGSVRTMSEFDARGREACWSTFPLLTLFDICSALYVIADLCEMNSPRRGLLHTHYNGDDTLIKSWSGRLWLAWGWNVKRKMILDPLPLYQYLLLLYHHLHLF